MADETTPANDSDKAADEALAREAEAAAGDATALAAEVKDIRDKLLRTLAEMENLRRRTEREIADQKQYAVSNFARDVLTVGDNLRRALDHVPKDKRGSGDAALDALIEGVEVTARGLDQSLTKYGIRRIETKGQKFDPTMHQAMYEVEGDGAPGTVADEVQAGYAIGERVLRPALVAVIKRAARPAEAARETAAEPAAPADPGLDGDGG